jgi:hypothetical protein
MTHHTKRHTKRMSSRRHRRGHRMMKGGYVNPNSQFNSSTFVSSPNVSDAATYETATVGTFPQQMRLLDSPTMAHSNGIDYTRLNPSIMKAAEVGSASIQNGGRRQKQYQNQQQQQNQYQRQYQNQQQQQNQKGGVWNQMIGDAVAPLVLLGLQQYYGPRSKSRMHKKSYKGKRTRRYRK